MYCRCVISVNTDPSELLTPKPHLPEASEDSYLKNQDVSNLDAQKA